MILLAREYQPRQTRPEMVDINDIYHIAEDAQAVGRAKTSVRLCSVVALPETAGQVAVPAVALCWAPKE